jgi:hypothetical protein
MLPSAPLVLPVKRSLPEVLSCRRTIVVAPLVDAFQMLASALGRESKRRYMVIRRPASAMMPLRWASATALPAPLSNLTERGPVEEGTVVSEVTVPDVAENSFRSNVESVPASSHTRFAIAAHYLHVDDSVTANLLLSRRSLMSANRHRLVACPP